MLRRLLLEDMDEWNRICESISLKNQSLRVPTVNDTTTLHHFNVDLSDLFTEANYHFGKARRNKDAIERIIENTLKDYYKGPNEIARKAAGLQLSQRYPVPESIEAYYPYPTVNLFELQDKINGYFYDLDAVLKTLQIKSGAKITNNSILNIEKSLISY